MKSQTPVLEVRSAEKRYGTNTVLSDVDFSLLAGEIHGLVGRNGAGKSTLVSSIMGLVTLDSGEVLVDGNHLVPGSPGAAIERGLAMVPQRLALMPDLSVTENLLTGTLPVTRLGRIDWPRAHTLASEHLAYCGLTELDPRRTMGEMGFAARQMITIAKAVSLDARAVILDEPTAPLARPEIERLFEIVRALASLGAGFVYISHHLEEVFDLCERVTILRDGHSRGTFDLEDFTPTALIDEMGRATANQTSVGVTRSTHRSFESREPLLMVAGLSDGVHFADVSLTVRPGEVVGLTGVEGCGKHEVVEALFGLRRSTGLVSVGGHTAPPAEPKEAIRRGMSYLPQDRRRFGVVEELTIGENLVMNVLDSVTGRGGFISGRRERQRIAESIEDYHVACTGPEQLVGTLSGGNQQKVALAKMMQSEPSVLLLEEPTQGIDVTAKVEILELIERLVADGVGVLLVSDEIETLLNATDRIIVMRRGRVHDTYDPAHVDGPELLNAIEGLF